MRNILFFFSSTVVGGAETNILKISRELTKKGYNVFWCVLVDNGPLFKSLDFELAGVLVSGLYYKQPYKFYKHYKKFVKTNQIEIVFNFGLRVEIISRLISKRYGIKRIVSNIRSTDDWRKWYHIFLDRLTQKSVDLWISNSLRGKEVFIQRERVPENKMIVIYNFYEPPAASYVKKSLNPEQLRIGVLANITKEKGYFDLIPFAQKLSSRKVNFKIIYAGKDKLDGLFMKMIIENRLTNYFNYWGYVSNKESFFSDIDVFLLPSYLEGMPTSVLEALSYEKIVIATDVGGVSEIIEHELNGYLCAPGDIENMVQLACNASEEIANKFCDYNKIQLLSFSKQHIMNQWIRVINTTEQ